MKVLSPVTVSITDNTHSSCLDVQRNSQNYRLKNYMAMNKEICYFEHYSKSSVPVKSRSYCLPKLMSMSKRINLALKENYLRDKNVCDVLRALDSIFLGRC